MFNQLRGTTAPLPTDDVATAYEPFGESRMLPRRAYVDPAVHEWEQANIFSGWMCLGRGEKFAEPGAQFTNHDKYGAGRPDLARLRIQLGSDAPAPDRRREARPPRSAPSANCTTRTGATVKT